jgi:hypothetical protein
LARSLIGEGDMQGRLGGGDPRGRGLDLPVDMPIELKVFYDNFTDKKFYARSNVSSFS